MRKPRSDGGLVSSLRTERGPKRVPLRVPVKGSYKGLGFRV